MSCEVPKRSATYFTAVRAQTPSEIRATRLPVSVHLDPDRSLDEPARAVALCLRRWPGASPRHGLPPRGCDRGKGVPHLGPSTWVLHGRAAIRRGLGHVWPGRTVMTRARALKTAIRARVAKTGERYTTARRHVLRDLSRPEVAAPPAPAPAAKARGGL